MLTKAKLRNRILRKLKTQKEESRNRKSGRIKSKLFRTQLFKRAKRVMFYVTFDGEVDTRQMITHAKKLGKIVAAPVCRKDKTMRPCRMKDVTQLVKGLYGVYEPAVKEFMRLEDLDLVIVPGIAFDTRGNRLGRGKGYYDRFLHKIPKKTTSIGLAFDFQILPDIPIVATDARVDRVICA
jgi:5-formyltetrahydrofolate cyclo-ligase